MLFHSERSFELWDYHVSHRQLLIRSPMRDALPANIDLIFVGVSFLKCDTFFQTIELDLAQADEIAQLGIVVKDGVVYRIKSCGGDAWIAASQFKVLSNTLPIFESSLEYLFKPRTPQDYGIILAES